MTDSLFFILFSIVIAVNGEFGVPAGLGEHKYAAAIFKNRTFYCAGTVINTRYILTAGHCLENVRATDLEVVVGAVRISNSPSTRWRSVRKTIKHPGFSRPICASRYVDNDIGLIELDDPLIFGAAVGSIPLTISSGPQYRLSCRQVLFRDRVTRNNNQEEVELRHRHVVVTELKDCEDFFVTLFKNEMCILHLTDSTSPLGGDSGSPTICDGHVFGVLSSGLNGVDSPGRIFMIAPYLEWIASIVDPRK